MTSQTTRRTPPTAVHERHRLRMDDGAWLFADTAGPRQAPVTVVMAHGWCLDRTSWDDVTRLLLARSAADGDRQVRVVRYDQRGHGRSSAPAGRGRPLPSIARLGDDLATVVDRLAPRGRLVLAGHSMGGMSIMAAVGRHRELISRVDGVLLAATTAHTEGLELPVLPTSLPAPVRARLLDISLRTLARVPSLPPALTSRGMLRRVGRWSPRVALGTNGTRRLLFGPDASPELVAAAHAVIGRTSLRTLAGYYLHALTDHDERESLSALAGVPTTVVVGNRDRLTPSSHSQAIARAVPGARLVPLEARGHMITMECPETLVDELLTLVDGRRR